MVQLQVMIAMALTGVAGRASAEVVHFVDPLPRPPVLRATGPAPHRLTLSLSQISARIHRDLPETAAWGYGGSSPGPTIEVESGEELQVTWQNQLPARHIFPLPSGADAAAPDVRTVTHLHGAAVAEPDRANRARDDDGWPDAWIRPGETQLAVYPNQQSARILWYHDHAMGTTGRNVAAGLVGLYLIHDDVERRLNLPAGPFDVPLILQSRQLDPLGRVVYTDDITKEYYGNATMVNGKLWPYLEVEPRKYRFRIVNAANARTFGLKFFDKAHAPGPAIHQIGSDGGFLAATVLLDDPSDFDAPRLALAPGERADVIVDFSAYAGQTLILNNNDADPQDSETAVPDVLQMRVSKVLSSPDTSSLPGAIVPVPRLAESDAVRTRRIVFDQMPMAGGRQMPLLNGRRWSDPIEEKPVLGTTEIWELVNPLYDVHPFHIHLVGFQVLDRALFDVDAYRATGKVRYLGPPVPPADNEFGWKDTVKALPRMVTRVILRFTPFPGFYVYHCHILEHEDMDMMRPFQIVTP